MNGYKNNTNKQVLIDFVKKYGRDKKEVKGPSLDNCFYIVCNDINVNKLPDLYLLTNLKELHLGMFISELPRLPNSLTKIYCTRNKEASDNTTIMVNNTKKFFDDKLKYSSSFILKKRFSNKINIQPLDVSLDLF